jgi:hypothetical protein
MLINLILVEQFLRTSRCSRHTTGVDSPQVLETRGSLQLVPQTPTTRKAETYSNQSTTIHERIPSSYRPTRFDVIERELVHSFIR